MKYYFGFWDIQYLLLCLFYNYHRYKQDFFFKKKVKRNIDFFFKMRFLKFIIYFLQGFLNPPNYEIAQQIPENNYQCFPATRKTNSPYLQIPQTPGAHIHALSYIQWFFEYVAPTRFRITAITFIVLPLLS